jgi:hypothetical protein
MILWPSLSERLQDCGAILTGEEDLHDWVLPGQGLMHAGLQVIQKRRLSSSHIRLFFAYTRCVRVVGHDRRPDWPKLGPSILIATALIVAIRTAKWAAKASGDPHFSDVDVELDKEVSFAARISIRVMHELLRKHESLFPQQRVPIYEAGSEEDSPP